MKFRLVILITFTIVCASACGNDVVVNNAPPKVSPSRTPSPSPAATTVIPKDGDYDAKGVVTKIDLELGSVEIDHEDIPGLMPAMLMEFYVSDKKLLNGLKVGDKIDFVLRYKAHTETVVNIKKQK